ncbi:hypothetical protein FS749_004993 [Ceratobasidium sp. UAMH 11750]|nr:hypothetical protein FS749_004993 [Ceratobasidium sp. UAMH 11750]
MKKIVSAALSNIYGVQKFSFARDGEYPPCGSKLHMDWPSQVENGVKVPLHRFDFSEAYDSPKNKSTYNTWIETALAQGPALARIAPPSPDVFNRQAVISACGTMYSSFKSRNKTKAKAQDVPPIPLKRKTEAVDDEGEEQLEKFDAPQGQPDDFSYTEYLNSNALEPVVYAPLVNGDSGQLVIPSAESDEQKPTVGELVPTPKRRFHPNNTPAALRSRRKTVSSCS